MKESGMSITALEPGRVYIQFLLNTNPKLDYIPDFLLDLMFRNGAFLFLMELRR